MGAVLVRAIAQRIGLLFVVSVMAFAVVHLAPGEPSQVDPMNPRMKPQDIARIRAAFHLDEPLPVQYGYWLRDLASGDLRSFQNGEPVLERIWERFLNSVPLVAVEILVIWTFAFPVGIRAALTRGSAYDRGCTLLSYALIPSELLPGIPGDHRAGGGVHARDRHAQLRHRSAGLVPRHGPALAPGDPLAAGGAHGVVMSRYVRSQMSRSSSRTSAHRAPPACRGQVIYKHALRNALSRS
jgi:peptide/nickel transport system permease protein